ncbi:conserved hypothetical protein [Roseibium sp. TrichSKD4]|uniref:hypothetical protein n=1 Tax=Roseibium sp. TrichSKD4 TaxID=744980 RepID=UPI0001E56679|nr:hypothetical protein [Roseibium sp. TrichSKD4]EFO33608.1 conserved hypothetical protein [Roseibium sp. TrichSKD4]
MTAQPKWTPGPWHVVKGSPDIRGSVGHKIAEVNIGFDFLIHCRSSIEAVCNSYLIAAAPELYGAAQLALQIAEDTIRR